jgi:thiamine pyrophosphokinase
MSVNLKPRLGVTLLGGGEVAPGALAEALSLAPDLVAVDGGADRALAEGWEPRQVIGDLDSISDAARARLADRLVHVPTQDDTDFDKALDRVQAPLVLALGFTGGRLDHTLAAMSSLARRPGVRAVVWGQQDLCFLTPPRLDLTLPPGSRLSLWPLAPVGCVSSGLMWPTDGLRLDPAGVIGTSNAVSRGAVSLEPDAPALLCLVPLAAVAVVLAALSAAPPWPAPVPAR